MAGMEAEEKRPWKAKKKKRGPVSKRSEKRKKKVVVTENDEEEEDLATGKASRINDEKRIPLSFFFPPASQPCSNLSAASPSTN